MKRIFLQDDEKERLEVLRKYQILDTDSEKDFEDIVELASQLCDSPMAVINFIDDDRQWAKAIKGIDVRETNREVSFCTHAIESSDVMIVNDARIDARFRDNPFVLSDPGIRFYAGMPLVVESGHRLGTLCVLDRKPKTLTDLQVRDLKILARQVINLLNLRLTNIHLQKTIRSKTTELANFFDRIGDAFISLDKNWNYVFANKQVGDLLRRDPKSLIGKNVWEEFPEAVNSATYQAFHAAMRQQRYICHIDYFEPLNLWQENHIYPSPEGLSVFIRDISERKQAELKLVQSIETLERAEEQAKMGSWQIDLITGERFWSKQLFLMFGFDPAGETPTLEMLVERVHPEDHDALLSAIEKIEEGQDPGKPVIRTNPTMLPLIYILAYTRLKKDADGNVVRYEGTMLDVTELHKTNHELDHFVYSISHDLRSPLSSILGLLNVAEMERPAPDTAAHLKRIRDQVNRLDKFIRDVLDYSMNARLEMQYERIDFSALISDAENRAKQTFHIGRINTSLLIHGGEEFHSDRVRLDLILNNLFSNSVKYRDPSKDSCAIDIRVEVTQQQAKIIFSDNGIGIEPVYLPKIFNMFFRATENAKGSGLGLYIAKEAVSKLGGVIKAESEFGHGTTFEITLPNFVVKSTERQVMSSQR